MMYQGVCDTCKKDILYDNDIIDIYIGCYRVVNGQQKDLVISRKFCSRECSNNYDTLADDIAFDKFEAFNGKETDKAPDKKTEI